ncbi:MAG: NAD-dependent epimerase/dehydratase family protein, partial [Phycisphaerales bacterium]
MTYDWKNKTVLVTGGAGFLGRHVIERLKARGVRDSDIYIPRRANWDLTNAT